MTRVLLVLALLALSACDRQRVDPLDSQLAVSSPDLGVVLLEPDLTLRFDTAGPASGATVRIDGAEVPRDSVGGGFVYQTTLARGLNALRVEITDEAGDVRRDTLYALHLPIQLSGSLAPPSANVRRVGAAAAPLDNSRVLITGGLGAGTDALSTATVLTVFGSQVSSTEIPLEEGRVGHTATRLPDGQVLVLGGVRTRNPGANDFVGTAEVVTPGDLSATPLDEGGPRRAYHTARALRLDGRTYVYAIGGIVPAGSGYAPSRTADVFEYVPGVFPRLDRLTPPGGASVDGLAAVVGGALIPTSTQESVLFGLSEDDESVARRLIWRTPGAAYPFALTARAAAPLATARTDAAGVPLDAVAGGDGLVLVAGGRTASGRALATVEVYAPGAGRTFRFPDGADPSVPGALLASPRFAHTATMLGGGRILITGGLGDSNVPLASLEILQL